MKYLLMLLLSLSAYAQQTREPVNVGATANDGTGDPLRAAYQKLNTNDFKLWRTVYTNTPINVKDFGAVGDGVTDDAAAIQSALNSITAKGVVRIPYGVYKVNSPLTLNVSKVRIVGDNAKLDFTGIGTTNTAINITGTGGGVGAPYYQAFGGIESLEIAGPGPSGSSRGLYLNTAAEPGTSHSRYANLVVYGFNKGIEIGNNAYLYNFDNCDIHSCETGLFIPAASSNSGESLRFIGGVLYNNTGWAIKSENINAFIKLIGTSVDYNAGGLWLDQGRVDLLGAHFESNHQPHIYVPTNNPAGLAVITASGGLFYRNVNSTNPMINLQGRVQFTAIGTEIHDYATTNAAKIFGSTNSSVFIFGGRMIYNPSYTMLDLQGNNTIVNWDWNGGILESAGLYSKNEVFVANKLTVTNQIVAGTLHSDGNISAHGTAYPNGLYVTNNIVGNGPGFFNSTLQVSSNLTALASVNASAKVTAGTGVESTTYVQAQNGIFRNNNNTVTCTATSTWYNVGTGRSMGLYLFRDQTSGGVATVMADTGSITTLTNTITGFEMQYDGGTTNFQIRVTSGAAPRAVRWTHIQTSDQ